MPRWRRLGLIAGALVVLGGVASLSVYGIRWRAELMLLKLKGGLDDLSWREIGRMTGPGSVYWLEPLVANPNPYSVIENPFASEEDTLQGAKIFRTECSTCHGSTGEGVDGVGPNLAAGKFQHGASDWALYRTISRGIPGSAMQAHDRPDAEVWQLVAYLRSLDVRSGSIGESAKPALSEPFPAPIDFSRVAAGQQDPQNWLSYGGNLEGWRHSALEQINHANIERLHLAWVFQMRTAERRVETSPVVVDGVMYLTTPPNNVRALDARTGKLLWSYDRTLPAELSLCCGQVNRGVALLDDKVYLGTLDAQLVALNYKTGEVEWSVQVADPAQGYSITSAPLAIDGKVVIGVAGGEFGIRGFLDAYDASSGHRIWRHYTIPGPGEDGHDTWAGDSWETGGGPTWVTGSYDPTLDLLYWGVGNPAPGYQGDARPGDNLFTNSVIALDAATGEQRWYFQFTPHDEHDWDAGQTPILIDLTLDGQSRRALVMATKNGFFYVLDRGTGEFLLGRQFARQTWAEGLTERGVPIARPEAAPTSEGTLVYPSSAGATNWWPGSYSPVSGLYYIPVSESGGIFFKSSVAEVAYHSGDLYLGSASDHLLQQDSYTAVRAFSPASGELRWEYKFPPQHDWANIAGVLSTAGDLIFFGNEQTFYALDARTGEELWHRTLGGYVVAPPVSYMVAGRQFVSVAAGRALFTFAVDE